jgi:prevent-host-death family protein
METRVGIRELKSRLSEYLRQVKSGATLLITEHGNPVGRITPIHASMDDRLEELIQAGIVAWSGNRLGKIVPVASTREDQMVSDLLLEDRE